MTTFFLDNVFARAGDMITVENHICHSDVRAVNQVAVGSSGNKGSIISGYTRATNFISTDFLGSTAEVTTVAEVGIDPDIREKYNMFVNEIDKKQDELDDLKKSIKHFESQEEPDNEEKKNKLELQIKTLKTVVIFSL